jgi:5-methylcytosine-specific restriction enzyme subunit McrC
LGKGIKHITVFEHDSIKLNQKYGDTVFEATSLKTLQTFYGEKGMPYYSLIHNGIRFCEYVGVIQVGNIIIEVLPKADKNPASEEQESKWRRVLIDMLRAVNVFNIQAPSSSSLYLKSNAILDLYFELFLQQVEYLLHSGLIKKYCRIAGNTTALKGNIQFSKHIQNNFAHKERFYVRYTSYNNKHVLHQVLYKTLLLLKRINKNEKLQSRIGSLLLNFPEQHDIKVSESLFDKIIFDRKSEGYKNAIAISRLLLLNFHPDVLQGRNHVLALMFDMNLLWEQFVYASLRKYKTDDTSITSQNSKYFWKPLFGTRTSIRPDIVINKDKENCIVLDTKWKNLNGYNPSPDDLRQMFVYHQYFNAKKVALLYPGDFENKEGKYFLPDGNQGQSECSVMGIAVHSNVGVWQSQISAKINDWIKST